MAKSIGRIFASSRNEVLIAAFEGSNVSVGDILYVKVRGLKKVLLLHVKDITNKLPIGASKTLGLIPSNIEPSGSFIETAKEKTVIAYPMFLITEENDEISVARPSIPPNVNIPVHILENDDDESRKIMEMFSKGIPSKSLVNLPIGILRSGTASSEFEKKRKYFDSAKILVDFESLIPKHILISGQTGAGKTTSIMGLIINWILFSSKPFSWLIIDRHGEYSRYSSGSETYFLNKLAKALSLNENEEMNTIGTYVYKLFFISKEPIIPEPKVEILFTPVNVGSLTVDDVAMALELRDEETVWLEMILETLENIVLSSDLDENWKRIFERSVEGALSGHLLPLLIAVVDNMCNYEGVGEKGKVGVYKEFLHQGVYIQKLRLWRNRILSILNLTTRKYTENGGVITVLDDSRSIFKVSEIFKNKYALRKLLEALARSPALSKMAPITNYKWYRIESEEVLVTLESGISISAIVEKLDEGNIVIIDVSTAPSGQADALVLNVVRRLLLSRVGLSPEEIRKRKIVAIVSEEAPLYLSPDKVKSPRNAFARIAREGRKFNIGLIAITQLATMIEKQLLANMNTLIVLRTKYKTDIEYFSSIGMPSHEIPVLNDREGYLYTPDIRVRDPIPAYFLGWFEIKIEETYEPKSLEEIGALLTKV